MTQRRSKKRTLISSIISLILCVSMLLGTTMAWFTDTVSNTGNRIMTGELGVQLLKYEGTDYTDISDGQGDIFATQGEEGERLNGILWEPGKTEVVLLQVANTGNLALNYNIILDIANEGNEALEEVLSYAIIPNVAGKAIEGEANVLNYNNMAINGWQDIASLQGIETGAVTVGSIKAAPNGALLAGESDYFALAVHMDEDADNRYQNQSIVIDVKVEAKQMASEYDSFGNQYDANADYGYLADAITYHVSTTGSDENPGTEEAPFATLAKANEVISALDKEGEDVQVLIHGGTYFMAEDVVFSGAAAGGSGDNKVVYRAAGDGEVVFSGFIEIPGNRLTSASNSKVGSTMSEEARENLVSISLGSSTYGLSYKNFEFLRDDNGTYQDKNEVSFMPTYFTLLLNGKEQMIAQWPNYGQSEVIESVVDAGGKSKGGEGATFNYSYSNIDNWGIVPADESRNGKSFSDAIIRGYLSANYREEWNRIDSVDKENQTIKLRYYSFAGVKAGRDWRILNLPEELDVPGEYCIDWNIGSLALYYYPPYKLTSDDVLQLSVAKGVSFVCEDTSNIVFDGIKFTGIRNADRSQGVITVNNCDNVEIRNCTFTYNDGSANIVITGTNNTVEACGFYNCGASGVMLRGGGDYETLEPQNNMIINNHFYNTGTSCNETQAGAVTTSTSNYTEGATVGNIIRNNLIHHIYGAMNVLFNGVEYDISYNEVSNGMRDLADYGMIYTGARPIVQGTTINYNYIHDFGSMKNDSYATNGIYIDDWASGQTAHNNIIVSNNTSEVAETNGIISVGAYQNFKYNIMANSTRGVRQGSRTYIVGDTSTGLGKTMNSFLNKIPTFSEKWKEKYPHMLTLKEAAVEGQVFPIMNNVITDNITYNAPNSIHEDAYTLGGTITNNLDVADATGVFVDPSNHDWRITSAYAKANNLNENIITEDNFSMDQIGIQKDVWAISNPKESFKQVYPTNGSQSVQPNDVTLNWEKALFADEYEYVVAKDAELKNVVASGTSVYEFVNVGDLVTGETYYWKITAVNTTRQLAASWDSEEVFSFTVASEKADKSKLVRAISAATEAFATVADGTEGTVGDYMVGTKAKLTALLESANTLNAKEDATQDEVDEMTSKLNTAVDGLDAYKYKGYVTVDTSDASKWKSTNANTTFAVEDGVMSVTGTKVVTYTETIPNYNMITFDVKADLSDTKMLGFMVRSTKPEVDDVYEGLSYFFWITSKKIELQIDPADGKQQTVVKLDYADTASHPMYTTDWQNIRIETIDKEGGAVEIVLYADNEEIIRYEDTQYMLHGTGTFAVQRQGNNGVQLRAASSLPTFQN